MPIKVQYYALLRHTALYHPHTGSTNEKRTDNTKLVKNKESVLSELEKLRGLNRAHRKLMVEIWQHLTALARVGVPPHTY